MPSPNLLITGATGFIGFHVLLKALEEGWVVRATVRSISKSGVLADHPKIKGSTWSDRLSFVEVPDICDENAYEQAIKGVTHVIHLASPLPSPLLDPQTGIYEPNINSVNAMLRAAAKEPTLQKLVITTSALGNSPFPPDLSQRITAEFRVPNLPGPFNSTMSAYWGGKIAATNAIDTFVKENNPSFGLSVVFPGFVFGKDQRALKVEDVASSTNQLVLGFITGQDAEAPLPAGAVDIDDTAKIFVLALKDDAPRNIGSTMPHVFDEAWNIVTKHFPKAVETGIFTKGSRTTIPVKWDSSQTEQDFDFKFKSFEEMVVDIAGQYLELSGKEKA
ncbi:putative cinnamoyl-CoA reductase [Xylaria cf. heliscus]|nr:putative cinnamoyl-CoA reductase [Xylaria cf. heliscus]